MGTPHDLPGERPTRTRYVVLTYLCLLSFVLYLDRVCISQSAKPIMAELKLDENQFGNVLAAFTIAYGLFMTAAGRLGDRYGSRAVLVIIVIWWSVFTALTGACTGLIMLITVRFVFGAGEAGAFPNCARIVSRWFPPRSRGLPQGLLNTAALVGGAAAPVAVAYLMNWIDDSHAFFIGHFGSAPIGWRWTFFIFGLLGVAWAVLFLLNYRDDPHTHPRVNAAERKLIDWGRELASPHGQSNELRWRCVLASRNVWLMGFIVTCASFVSYFYMSWLPTYLQSGRGADDLLSGRLASFVLAGGATGSLAGGLLSDWVMRRTGRKRTRSMIGFASMGLAGLAVLASLGCADVEAAGYVLSLAFFLMMLQIASWWGAVADISGPHTATLFGLMNSMGVIGGAGAQKFTGWLVRTNKDHGLAGRAQWDPTLYFFVAALMAGALAWLFVNSNKSAVEEPAIPVLE